MNLQEAMKSRLPIARKCWSGPRIRFLDDTLGYGFMMGKTPKSYDFKYQDVMADDWEVIREPVRLEFVYDRTELNKFPASDEIYSALNGKKWNAVMVEIIE